MNALAGLKAKLEAEPPKNEKPKQKPKPKNAALIKRGVKPKSKVEKPKAKVIVPKAVLEEETA
jgi:hypothetical protein